MYQENSSQSSQIELTNEEKGNFPLPKDIYEHLGTRIFGQDNALKLLSACIYNHYKRIASMNLGGNLEEDSVLRKMLDAFVDVDPSNVDETFAKSNLILIGPTGCGKTEMARSVATYLDVPFVIRDCTTLKAVDTSGEDVGKIITELYLNSEQSVAKTEMGIVFLDDVDEITDSSRFCALLRIIEGTKILVPKTLNAHCEDKVQIDTTNILFIAMGTFDGLDEIVRKRLNEELNSGEDERENDDMSWLNHIEPCDLIQYRFTPEFVGRFPMIVPLMPIDEQTLVSILTVPKNSILRQYEKLFKIDNVELIVSERAIAEIARVSVAKKIGVRGLQATLESILRNSMFEVPGSDIKQVLVTQHAVLDRNEVEYERRKV